MVYPTLLAVIGNVAHPAWRARAVGVYRLWRDLGVAAITAASSLIVAVRMYETRHPAPTNAASAS